MPSTKELHFFDSPSPRTVRWYERQFADAPEDAVVGEATPSYIYIPKAVARMKSVVPDAKLIALLRDPVDRAYSHYWACKALGREPLSFEAAVSAEPARLATASERYRRDYSYVDRGFYLHQLKRLTAQFSRERIHVVVLEDLIQRPTESLVELLTFLEAWQVGDPDPTLPLRNRHHEVRYPWLIPLTRNMKRLGPLGRHVQRGIARRNRTSSSYAPMSPQTREALCRVFAESVAGLEEWLHRDLGSWLDDSRSASESLPN
jgi:hypothetical protein